MEMERLEHRRQRNAFIAVPSESVMGVSRADHPDGRMAEVYGRAYSAETTSHPEENQHLNQVSKAMHISSTLMLIIASTAATLFVGVFAAAAVITRRNRRTIQKLTKNSNTGPL